MSPEQAAVERMMATLPFVDNLRHELMELIKAYGETERNAGFALGYNEGIEVANSDWP